MSKYWSNELADVVAGYVGRPYVANCWDSATGFSCWTFVHHVFSLAGVELPRDIYHASRLFRVVERPYQPMDIAYFEYRPMVEPHLGVMVTENAVMHCSEMTNGVARCALWRPWYTMALSGVYRLEHGP